MKKKVIICLGTFALAIGLVGCGSTDDTIGGYSKDVYEQSCQGYMSALESIGLEDIDSYISSYESSDDEVTASLLSDWKEVYDEKGEFLAYSDFDVTKSGKTITATLTSDYTGRDLKLIMVFNANKVDEGPTAINVEGVYSLGETMQKAGLNTAMGIGIVFIMLIVLSGCIKAFEIVPYLEKKFAAKSSAPAEAKPAPVQAQAPQPATDDLELVAVIAAAIAASTGASTDSFVVRSIKKRH